MKQFTSLHQARKNNRNILNVYLNGANDHFVETSPMWVIVQYERRFALYSLTREARRPHAGIKCQQMVMQRVDCLQKCLQIRTQNLQNLAIAGMRLAVFEEVLAKVLHQNWFRHICKPILGHEKKHKTTCSSVSLIFIKITPVNLGFPARDGSVLLMYVMNLNVATDKYCV